MKKKLLLLLVFLGVYFISSGQYCPPNFDVSSGSLTGWTFQIGWVYSGYTASFWGGTPAYYSVNWYGPWTTTPTPGYGEVTSAGTDYYVPISKIPPPLTGYPASTNAIRIGDNALRHDGTASRADYTFTIPSGTTNYSLLYRYAIVTEESHANFLESTRFMVRAFDNTAGDTLPCQLIVIGDLSTTPPIHTSTTLDSIDGGGMLYTDWQLGLLNLNGRSGDNITVDFSTSNCFLTHHFLYAYIDGNCLLWPDSLAGCYPGITTLPSAPPGFLFYQWFQLPSWAPIVGSTTFTPPAYTTYALVLTPATGAVCADTLYTRVGPAPGLYPPIVGPDSICVGGSATFTDPVPAGVWSSTYPDVSVDSATGDVTGLSPGTAIITYSLGACMLLDTIKINPPISPLSGPDALCVGSSALLTDDLSGGTFSTSDPNISLTGGVVHAISPGVATVTYMVTDGYCTGVVYKTISVYPLPDPISGPTSMCVGASVTLVDPGGGVWISADPGVSVGAGTGVVTGLIAGTATITYVSPSGCPAMITVTVNPLPDPIVGPFNVCEGSTITLSDPTSGGVWYIPLGYSSIATISPAGVVTGISAGTAPVTYTNPATGCSVMATILVDPLPAVITGTTMVCIGGITTLADGTPGGTWSSSDLGVAIIESSTGILTGISSGTCLVTYTLPTGCMTIATVTVNPMPDPIVGPSSVCVGAQITLSDATLGGTWIIPPAYLAIATIVPSTGLVTGIAAGAAPVTYILPAPGCFVTTTVTVNPLPAAITGTSEICQGNVTILSDATPGGTWSSNDPGIATVDSSSGTVTGTGPGVAIIKYALPTGCFVTTTLQVDPLPEVITGPTSLCVGSTITISDATPGGTWSTATLITPIVSINPATGVITGLTPGTATISYSLGTGCMATTVVTVYPYPVVPPVAGYDTLCTGGTTTLSDSIAGGVWSTTSTLVSISGGIVTAGTADGTAIVSYSVTEHGCTTTVLDTVIVVVPDPPITGLDVVCSGSGDSLHNEVAGGKWTSSNTTVATVDSITGVVTGLSTGTVTISYTATSPCGPFVATMTIIVNAVPFISTNFVVACQSLATSGGLDGGSPGPGNILPDTGCIDVCDSSIVRYYANGTGGSISWDVIGGVVVHDYGDSIDVLWPHVGTVCSITLHEIAGKCSQDITACIQVIAKPHAKFSPSAVSVCLGDVVSFVDLSTFDPLSPIVSWYWTFGDGTSSGVPDPTHTFTAANDHDTVTLVVKNACNCTDTFRVILHISSTPGPRIQCPAVVCEDETVSYTTSGGCGAYHWSVVGGTIVSGLGTASIMVKWDAVGPDGFGYVSLVEPCADCPDTTTIKVPVVQQNGIISGPPVVCAGQQYEFSLPLWPATQYMWGVLGFPADIVGFHDDHTVVVSFPTPGTYTIHAWYQNRLKLCGGNVDKTVTVLPKVAISGPTTVCLGSSNSYSLSAPVAATWQLTDYSGTVLSTATGSSVVMSFPVAGHFILTTSGSFCCTPIYITVDTLPPPLDSITGTTKICLGREYTYVAHGKKPGTILNWEITGGTLTPGAGSDSVSVHWTSTGTKQLSVNLESMEAPHCSGPALVKTVVTEAIFPHVLGSIHFCPNTVLPYSCDYLDGEVYDWNITPSTAGSVISGMHGTNISVQWNDYTGPATITVTVRKCDIITTGSLAVTITPPMPVTLTASPSPACPRDYVTFTALPAGASEYVWNFSDGSFPLTTTTNVVNHPFPENPTSVNAIYNVGVYVSGGAPCPVSGSAIFAENILPGPIASLSGAASFCPPATGTLTAIISPNVTVLPSAIDWIFGSSIDLGHLGTSITVGDEGEYSFSVVATNGCSTRSDEFHIVYNCTAVGGCTGPVPVTVSNNCNTIYLSAGDPSIDPSEELTWYAGITPISGPFPPLTRNVSAIYDWPGVYNFWVQGTFNGHCVSYPYWDTVGVVPRFWATKNCGLPGAVDITLHDNTALYPGWSITGITWSDGAGPIPPGPTPTYSRPPGSYMVTETVTGTRLGGGTFTCDTTIWVPVPAGPDASFSITTSPICENVPILFTPLSPDAMSYHWNFGDGASFVGEVPYRNYNFTATSGIDQFYPVTLTVYDINGCVATAVLPVDIFKNRLSGNIGPNPEAVCSSQRPLTLSYNPDPGTPSPVSWLWRADTANTLIGTGSTVDIYQSGTYWVTVVDTYQCVATLPMPAKNVEVIYTPPAVITGKTDFCYGDAVVLNGYAGKSATYQWYRDGLFVGTSDVLSDVGVDVGDHSYQLVVGVFDTALSVMCYDTSAFDTVHVHPLPSNPVITGPVVIDCSNYNLQLSATDVEPGIFNWSNGTVGPVDNIITGGPYRVTFTNTNNCQSHADVYVPFSPETYFPYFPTGCYTVCSDELPITLYGPPDVLFTYWAWLLNGYPDSYGSGLMLPYNITCSGNYQWDIDNGLCRKQSDTMQLTVGECTQCKQARLSVTVKCTPDNPACYSIAVSFINPAPGTTFVIGTDIGPIDPFSGVLPSPGYNTLTLTFATLYLMPLPPAVTVEIQFTMPDGTKCVVKQTVPLPSCSWIAERPASGGDSAQSLGSKVIVSNALMVFPNPASSNVNISYNYGSDNYSQQELVIYDELGRRLRSYQPQNSHGDWNINTADWAPGIYLIRMEGNARQLQAQKFVIEHH